MKQLADINACRANWLIIAIFHEMRFKRKILPSIRHIRKKIKETGVLKSISLKHLPLYIKFYLVLLKLHLYGVVVLGTYFTARIRKVS